MRDIVVRSAHRIDRTLENNGGGRGDRASIGLRCFAVSLLLASASAFAAPNEVPCEVAKASEPVAVLRAPRAESWRQVGDHIFGVSTLYHLDDDAFWRDPVAKQSLLRAGVRSFRFPGGEVGDRYDWKRHRLERPDLWPGEPAAAAELDARTDWREFVSHVSAFRGEIFFVVNVDGAFRASGAIEENLRRFAQRAAEWVRSVRQAGFHVRYWEIGNEPYGGGYPLTAEEYAAALNAFAGAMRREDPAIQIGAAGPGGRSNDAGGVGFADRIGEDALRRLRERQVSVKDACRQLTTKQCIDHLRQGRPEENVRTWWEVVTEKAGNSFDFAVVHRYERVNLRAIAKQERFPISDRLVALRDYLERRTGRRVPIALTEWNTPNENRRGAISDIEHVLDLAMQIGMNAAGGVEFAHYWPLQTQGTGNKPFLTKNLELSPAGELFAILSQLVPGASASQSMLDNDVYLFRFRRNGQEGALLVNNAASPRQFALDGRGQVTVWRLSERSGGRDAARRVESCRGLVAQRGQGYLDLPARSVTVATWTQ